MACAVRKRINRSVTCGGGLQLQNYRCRQYYDQSSPTSIILFTARCYASAVLAMGLCLSVCVCLSVCLSHVGVPLKRLNVGSHKQHHTIAQGL